MIRFAPRHAALAAVFLVPALGASAQTVLTPGMDGLASPPPQSYEREIRIVRDVPQVVGQAVLTESLDGDRLTTTSRVEAMGGGQEDVKTTVVAWPSLAPISRSTSDGEETIEMTVADGRISGRRQLGNLDEALDAVFPDDAFGEGMGQRLARSIPLSDGYTATFRTVDPDGMVSTDTLTVTGGDAYTPPGGEARTVWLVRHAGADSQASVYTVDAETREVLRATQTPRPGLTIEVADPLPMPDGPVLRPGDAALNTSWLRDADDSFVIRVVEPVQMDAGTMTMRRTVADGVVTTVSTLTVQMQGMEVTTTAMADAATLAPVSVARTGSTGAASLSYSDGSVAGSTEPEDGDGEPIAATFEAPVFDSSWSSEIAQSLPFETGYSAAVESVRHRRRCADRLVPRRRSAGCGRRRRLGRLGGLVAGRDDVRRRCRDARDPEDAA